MAFPDAVQPTLEPSPAERRRSGKLLWAGAAALYRQRRFIIAFTVIGALASIAVALMLPKWYAAEARLVKAENSMMSLSGILGQVGGGLGALVAGGSGGYEQQLAIFTGPTYRMRLIEDLGLIERYELSEEEEPMDEALLMLNENLEFEVDLEFFYLSIRAYDQDPAFAARMANYAVDLLNESSISVSARGARQTREYIGRRLGEAEAALDSVRSGLQAFQEENGVVELETQAAAYIQSVAEQRGRVAEAGVRYRTLASLYGPDNAQVIAAREGWRAAQSAVNGAMAGQEAFFPIALGDLPELSRRYVQLKQEELIQARTLETVYPLHEQALFEEQNEADVLTIVDPAYAPVLAARPSRRLIVISVTLTALLLACAGVLAQTWIRQEGPVYLRHFRSEIA